METRQILVTGGSGFIGRWISKVLIENGHQIYIADDLSGSSLDNIQEFSDNTARFYQIDLSDSDKAKSLINNIKPDVIYHLASNAREGASFFDPVKMAKTNFMTYMNTLEPAIKAGQLAKVILFSSMAVYGRQSTPFNEKMHRRPIDIYAINKSAMEQSTEMLSDVHNFSYTIIRPHNVYGEFQSLKDKYRNVIGIWMNEIMRNEPITIYGSGNQIRSFSYIQNSLDCYINAMNDNCDGEIINIGGMKPITINDASKLVMKHMGVDTESYPVNHLPERYGEIKVAYCSWDKSEKLLGYKENVSLDDGVRHMAKWALSKGPQEWTDDRLELWNNKCPNWWK